MLDVSIVGDAGTESNGRRPGSILEGEEPAELVVLVRAVREPEREHRHPAERLAQDLAEKQRRRAEAAKAAKSSMVKEKSKKPWEEGGGLYEGISYF